MCRSLLRGIWIGLIGSLSFVAAIVYWIYRYTRKVPFPTERTGDGGLVIRLVAPQEVPTYWRQWMAELEPLRARLRAVREELAARYREWRAE